MIDKKQIIFIGVILATFSLLNGCSKKHISSSPRFYRRKESIKPTVSSEKIPTAIIPEPHGLPKSPTSEVTTDEVTTEEDLDSPLSKPIMESSGTSGLEKILESTDSPRSSIIVEKPDALPKPTLEITKPQHPHPPIESPSKISNQALTKTPETTIVSIEVVCKRLWEKAKIDKSIKGFQEYLDQCPNGSHGNEAKAEIKKIEKAMEEDRDWERAKKENTIEGYYAFAKKYPESKRVNMALQRIQSDYWQDQTNKNEGLHNSIQLGWAYYQEREYEKARAIFEEKERLAPKHKEIQLALGKIYYSLGESQIAMRHLEKAVSLAPSSSETWFYMGRCHEKFSSSEAIECFNKAIRLNPSYTVAYFHRGTLHRLMLNFKAATKDFQKIIDLNDNQQLVEFSKKMIPAISPK